MEWLETVDMHAVGEGGRRYQTKATNQANWLSNYLELNLVAHLREGIPELDGLEAMCPKLFTDGMLPAGRASTSGMGIFRWDTAWRGRFWCR